MKKTLLKYAGIAALAFAVSSTASAAMINGAITFSGGAALDGATIGTSTQVTSWDSPVVQSRDGDFSAFAPIGAAVTIAAPWTFNSGSVNDFWMVGGFTFDLIASSVTVKLTNALIVEGHGLISGNGFDETKGAWTFTSQGGPADGIFSFSSSTESVPDGGTTAALLGAALVGMSLLARRRSA